MYDRHKILTIHEKYVVELICELIRQLRGKPLFDYLTGNLIPPDINTRRGQGGLLKSTYNRTKLKWRAMEKSIMRTYNWLRMLDVILQIVKKLTEIATKKNPIHNIAHWYASNKKKSLMSFFDLHTDVCDMFLYSPCNVGIFLFFEKILLGYFLESMLVLRAKTQLSSRKAFSWSFWPFLLYILPEIWFICRQ